MEPGFPTRSQPPLSAEAYKASLPMEPGFPTRSQPPLSAEAYKASLPMEPGFPTRSQPPPSFCGGYRVIPETIEFWQGGRRRLHDRFLYTRNDDQWDPARLAP